MPAGSLSWLCDLSCFNKGHHTTEYGGLHLPLSEKHLKFVDHLRNVFQQPERWWSEQFILHLQAFHAVSYPEWSQEQNN